MNHDCPQCRKNIDVEYGENARSFICPNCKKRIHLGTPASNLVPDKNGILRKKYKPKK